MPENFNFSLTCPKCHSPLTSQDFAQDHFTIAHLQEYFQVRETEYKAQLLLQMEKEIENFPLFKQLKEENEKLKSDFGIIIATCRSGNPLWKPFPSKNILVSDDDNFLFASQMARLLLLAKQRLSQGESAEERIKK